MSIIKYQLILSFSIYEYVHIWKKTVLDITDRLLADCLKHKKEKKTKISVQDKSFF
jgi:hypothetical protein